MRKLILILILILFTFLVGCTHNVTRCGIVTHKEIHPPHLGKFNSWYRIEYGSTFIYVDSLRYTTIHVSDTFCSCGHVPCIMCEDTIINEFNTK